MRETRAELKTRLMSEGRWDSYIEKRDALIATRDMSTKEASVLLTREFGVGATCVINVETGAAEETTAPSAVPVSEPAPSTPVAAPAQPRAASSAPAAPIIPARAVVTLNSFGGRTCSETEAIRWVFENLAVEDLKPDDAPSSGAWGLLQECKRSPSMREDFLKTIWPKLLPTRQQMEMMEKFSDNGQDVLELIAKLQSSTSDLNLDTNSEQLPTQGR